MQPIAEPPTSRRALVDRLALGILLGVVVVSIGAVALFTVYMNRIEVAAEGLRRVDALPSYEGRPVAVGSDGVAAVNYLLMTTSQDGSLESVLIAHLSASRRHLTLIALPADLIADDGSGRLTLATSYRLDPLRTARAVESPPRRAWTIRCTSTCTVSPRSSIASAELQLDGVRPPATTWWPA